MARTGESIGDPAMECFGLGGMGYAALGMGRSEDAAGPLESAVRIAGELRHEWLQGLFKAIYGMQRFTRGEVEEAVALEEEALGHQVPHGDYEGSGLSLSFLASMTFAQGDLEKALELYGESEASFGTVGDKPEMARVQCEMAYAELAGGSAAASRWTFQRAVRTYDEVGSPRGTGQALMGLAAAEAACGNAERALAIAAAAEVMSQKAGVVVEHPMAPGVAEQIEELKATVPRDKLDQLMASGSAMTPAEVLAMLAA
jgi:tetratricopeptide (TPR) repeat protein